MPRKQYIGMTDAEQAEEVAVFLQVLEQQPKEVQALANEAIFSIITHLQTSGMVKTFEHARDQARAIYWAIVQEKHYQEKRRGKL